LIIILESILTWGRGLSGKAKRYLGGLARLYYLLDAEHDATPLVKQHSHWGLFLVQPGYLSTLS
jgi:hypothetical protein